MVSWLLSVSFYSRERYRFLHTDPSSGSLLALQSVIPVVSIGCFSSGLPSISNPLVFTPGSSSSTLTCISTISVATTVTFTRDSDLPLTLRDGEEGMDTNGVTYQLSQTVTDRALSTYQNVLTINQPLGDIMGSSFTCSVANTIGSSSTSASLEIMGKFVINHSH